MSYINIAIRNVLKDDASYVDFANKVIAFTFYTDIINPIEFINGVNVSNIATIPANGTATNRIRLDTVSGYTTNNAWTIPTNHLGKYMNFMNIPTYAVFGYIGADGKKVLTPGTCATDIVLSFGSGSEPTSIKGARIDALPSRADCEVVRTMIQVVGQSVGTIPIL